LTALAAVACQSAFLPTIRTMLPTTSLPTIPLHATTHHSQQSTHTVPFTPTSALDAPDHHFARRVDGLDREPLHIVQYRIGSVQHSTVHRKLIFELAICYVSYLLFKGAIWMWGFPGVLSTGLTATDRMQ